MYFERLEYLLIQRTDVNWILAWNVRRMMMLGWPGLPGWLQEGHWKNRTRSYRMANLHMALFILQCSHMRELWENGNNLLDIDAIHADKAWIWLVVVASLRNLRWINFLNLLYYCFLFTVFEIFLFQNKVSTFGCFVSDLLLFAVIQHCQSSSDFLFFSSFDFVAGKPRLCSKFISLEKAKAFTKGHRILVSVVIVQSLS